MPIRISPAWHIACLALLAVVFLVVTRDVVYAGPYDYDEADYMFAAQRNWLAQATDDPTMSMPDFVAMGRAAREGNARQRASFSEAIRGSDDVVFYRHWHGPVLAYWLLALHPLHLQPESERRAGFLFPVLAAVVIYAGAFALFGGYAGVTAGFLSAALFLWSYAPGRSSELAPHQIFALLYLAALFLLSKAIQSGRRVYWYLAVAVAGIAFCTLEVAFALLATLAIAALLDRRTLAADWRFALRSLAIFAATVAVVWPAAIYKLSFVKAYAFMAYLALVRKNSWGDFTAGQVWAYRFSHFPIEWAIVAAALALAVFSRKQPRLRVLYPFLIFPALMMVAVMRVNTIMPRYLLTFEPALLAFAGMTFVAAFRAPRSHAIVAMLLASGVLANAVIQNRLNPVIPDLRGWNEIAFIRDHGLSQGSLLVPAADVPTVHYYFPQTAITSYAGPTPTQADFAGGPYAAVLYPGSPLRFEITK